MPFGAELRSATRTRFRLFAPDAGGVELCLLHASGERTAAMHALDGGWFELETAAPVGTRYLYRIDGGLRVPDPASRAQPEGPGGPSEVVDPSRHAWRVDWTGRPWREAVVYELHVGTFTAEGTFGAAVERLDHLAELGVTALELMPVASFPGARNWGYDGVLPYAPAAVYGGPEGLRALVDAAHARGLMVLLDVVYNHFGPEGNYLHAYAGTFFTQRHTTPWGEAINFDGPDSGPVRDFFIHNALYWLTEFRLDGLRLDAVHAIADGSAPDIVAALAAAVAERFEGARHVHLVLENDANEARYLRGRAHGGAGYTAQWNDDFHHAAHVVLTGERDGYYGDYAERPRAQLARCLAEGFAYQGEPSRYRDGAARGEPSGGLPSVAFINFLQNHDQIGNRAFGERLVTLTAPAPLRALVGLMLLAPGVPGLFMGEELGCRQPFLYFADFDGELAAAVRAGRRQEFARFARFADHDLPDPIAATTFRRCIIDWSVIEEDESADWLALYTSLLAIRRDAIVPRLPAVAGAAGAAPLGETGIDLAWRLRDGARLRVLANLGDAPLALEPGRIERGRVLHAEPREAGADDAAALPRWSVVWRLGAAGA